MQLNDTKIQEFGRNDGIKSILHCQEKFFISNLSNLRVDFQPSLMPWSIVIRVPNRNTIYGSIWYCHYNEQNWSISVFWIKNATVLLYQAKNAYYIRLQRHFMSLQEEFHKLEYEIEFQHFQNIVKKNNDWKDAKMNQNAKEYWIVSGMAIAYNSLHHALGCTRYIVLYYS